MDVLNRIKSTVQSTVGGLIGNPLSREFDIIRHHASAGPGYIWKICEAVKRSTKQEVAVFVLEKKLLEKYPRRERDFLLEVFKKGVTQLTRLRHPRLLTVQHPLEESRECLAFATEPVFASLGNVLGCHDNLPTPLPAELKDYQLYEVEMKFGLQQITEALAFLHNDVHMVHGNINPTNIVINQNGAWKLTGFDFCIASSTPNDQQALYSSKEWDPSLPDLAQPNLNYLAPEYIMTVSCDTASDMYSLGVVIYTVFNHGKPLFDCSGNLKTYQRNCQQLNSLNITMLKCLPESLQDYVKMLFSLTPTVRPDADQLTKIAFFDDVGAKTLECLDTLVQLDNLQKSQFFKGLPKIITKLPKRVVHQRVLPALFKEFYNADMIPFVLPNVLLIAEECTDKEYCSNILPHLKPVFKLQEPIQILLIFMQKMDLLLSKTPADDVKHHVLPMVYKALETPSPQIQELCLSIIPTFAGMIEYAAMKHSIVPRIKTLCLQTDLLSVRVNCLVCVGRLLEYMDKWYVLDEVFPLLESIPSREPAVLMGMLGIYKTTLEHKKLGITKDILATKVLPFLFPLCIDNNLNLNQFNAFISVVKEMMKQVETDQRSKLQQLSTMQKEQKSALEFAAETNNSGKKEDFFDQLENSGQKKKETDNMMDKMFKSFGLGGFIQSKSDKLSAASHGDDSPPSKAPSSQAKVPQSKVSLSLEEKQKLQKDQEQQRRLKSQQPLQPKEAPKQNKPQAKDLTATLTSSSMMGLTSNRNGSLGTGTGWSGSGNNVGMGTGGGTMGYGMSPMSGGSYGMQTATSGGGYGMGMTGTNTTFGMSGTSGSSSGYGIGNPASSGTYGTGMGSMSTGSSTGGFGMAPSGSSYGMGTMGSAGYGMGMGPQSTMYGKPQQPRQQATPPKSNIDLSAFDNLLGTPQSQKQKMSMNQMASQSHTQGQRSNQLATTQSQPQGTASSQNTASNDLSDFLG
ncbi:SCY1-like protein 2 isoform X2 [Ptychodera flava]|uniref:SCY1-like protein 2 isoform X2 n=1 Tax=Ptychodera flava TaxID=63121 RepID=UPI00396A28CF